jgi:hypothetical protein
MRRLGFCFLFQPLEDRVGCIETTACFYSKRGKSQPRNMASTLSKPCLEIGASAYKSADPDSADQFMARRDGIVTVHIGNGHCDTPNGERCFPVLWLIFLDLSTLRVQKRKRPS